MPGTKTIPASSAARAAAGQLSEELWSVSARISSPATCHVDKAGEVSPRRRGGDRHMSGYADHDVSRHNSLDSGILLLAYLCVIRNLYGMGGCRLRFSKFIDLAVCIRRTVAAQAVGKAYHSQLETNFITLWNFILAPCVKELPCGRDRGIAVAENRLIFCPSAQIPTIQHIYTFILYIYQ